MTALTKAVSVTCDSSNLTVPRAFSSPLWLFHTRYFTKRFSTFAAQWAQFIPLICMFFHSSFLLTVRWLLILLHGFCIGTDQEYNYMRSLLLALLVDCCLGIAKSSAVNAASWIISANVCPTFWHKYEKKILSCAANGCFFGNKRRINKFFPWLSVFNTPF